MVTHADRRRRTTARRTAGAARRLGPLVTGLAACAAVAGCAMAAPTTTFTNQLMRIDRSTAWKPAGAVLVGFETYHPQGMIRIGDEFFVSSVEIRRPPVRYPQPRGGRDRDAGAGVGRLFRIGADGALRGDIVLGEGDIYHPGGIDYDGEVIWIAVAEYRPNSRAIVYRVDPRTLAATEVLRVDDHIGAVAYDRENGVLHGVSWGGRRFYSWRLGPDGKPSQARVAPNRANYVDYQDCHYLGGRRMLCSGLANYPASPQGPAFSLGGWEIVDLDDHRPVWQAPIQLWAPSGRPMTQNPFFVEPTAAGVRAYFMPDDDRSTIYVYEAATP